MDEWKKKIEHKTIYFVLSILANMCDSNVDKIADLLTGYCWDEEECGEIKRSKEG